MCCAAQTCTVMRQQYFNKNLDVPKDVALPKDVVGEWCKQTALADVVVFPGDKIKTCYFQCRSGFYNVKSGQAMPYSCQANTDRHLAFGFSTTLKSCTGIA